MMVGVAREPGQPRLGVAQERRLDALGVHRELDEVPGEHRCTVSRRRGRALQGHGSPVSRDLRHPHGRLPRFGHSTVMGHDGKEQRACESGSARGPWRSSPRWRSWPRPVRAAAARAPRARGTGDQAAAAPATVDVSLTDFKIDAGRRSRCPRASAVTFNVSNHGQSPHTFGVEVGDQTYETPQIDAGSSATLEVPGARGRDVRRALHGARARSARHGGHAHGHRGRRPPPRRPARPAPRARPARARRHDRRGDGGRSRARRERLPRGQGDRHLRQPAARARDGRRREGLQPHGGADPVGGRQGRVRGRDGVQRAGARARRSA